MFTRRARLFRIFGFELKLDLSWVFIALLISWSLAHGYFPELYEGLPAKTYWSMGIIGAFGLFFSIVFHELSHSLVARRYGIPITGITLFILGGVAELEEEPKSAKAEFVMAIAGPIASLLLAGIFRVVTLIGVALELSEPLIGVVRYLAMMNMVLALFNLVPAFPLDGGRVFRAAVWHWTGDLRRATRVASQSGTVFAYVLMGLGLLQMMTGSLVIGIWWFVIGMFLQGAATASYHQMLTRRVLEGETVRRFMTPDPVTVPPHLPILKLVEDYIYRYHHDMFPVLEDSRLIGCVTTGQVKETPKDRWGDLTVREITVPCSDDNTIEADKDAVKALARINRTRMGRLMVTENGRLVGIIALKDILKLLALKIELEEEA